MKKRKIKAIVFNAPGKASLKSFNLPACGPDQVIAKTIYSFVSPGTELRVFSNGNESSSKAKSFPVIPGYSWVGEIIEIGSAVKGWKKGELVTGRNPHPIPGITSCWGGQASHHRCDVTGYDAVLKLPEGADPWDYVTVEVAAISWRGVTAAYPSPDEVAVVVGQGMIGAFAAKWLQYHGARVIVTDLVESRLKRARKWGVAAAINAGEKNIREKILRHCLDGADIVVEASASMPGAKLATSLLRNPSPRVMNTGYQVGQLHSNAHAWPRIVFQATYSVKDQMSPSGLIGVEGALVLNPGDRTVGDRLEVIERIRNKELKVKDIIDKPVPVSQAPKKYLELRDKPGKISSLAFSW